jgi:hypothetical protein
MQTESSPKWAGLAAAKDGVSVELPGEGMPEYTFSGSFDARSSRKRDSHLLRNTEGEIVVTIWTETLTRNAT